LFITSGDNITKVQAYFTDLETTEEGKIWISKNSIILIPKIFNVTSLRGTEANLLLDIHNHTGVYQGSMILQADHLKTTVPIS
jgi:hypothetical protein